MLLGVTRPSPFHKSLIKEKENVNFGKPELKGSPTEVCK